MRSVSLALVAMIAACYQPTLQESAPCGPGDSCPSGQECRAGTCFFTSTPVDARAIDSATLDAPRDAPAGYVPWGTPVENTSLEVSGLTNETDPTISANRLVVAISGGSGSGDSDIYIGTRNSSTAAFTVTEASVVNSGSDDQCPELTADGKTLYFASNRDGDYDIYVSTETNGVWSAPAIVTALSTRDDSNIALSPDGLTAIVVDVTGAQKFYLHTRATATSAWSTGTVLPDLAITTDIASPTITNNASTIYFHAGATRDIYMARRKPNGTFHAPDPVVELNTSSRDACPFVLQSDDYMMFERAGDIFETTR